MTRYLKLLALAATALALLAFAPLAQGKVVVNSFVATGGSQGGQFSSGGGAPSGIAVNSSGIGAPAGTVYTVDGNQNRIQRFSPAGAWERLWGQNVIGHDERQQLNTSSTSGTFTLTFGAETTAPIVLSGGSSGPRALLVQNALTALPSIGPNGVSVTGLGTTYTIRFTGAVSGTDVPQMVANPSGSFTASVSTLANGSGGNFSGFEICVVAVDCQDGSNFATTANGGQLNRPEGIAVNQTTGHVYVTEQGNRRISEFDADGNFIRTWGWDVTVDGSPSDPGSAAGFQICSVEAHCKQAAPEGANGGQLGDDENGLTVDSTGNVWYADPDNRRIQQFDSSGNFIAAYGYDVNARDVGSSLERCTSMAPGDCQAGTLGAGAGQFSSGQPRSLAFDSAGNLYASDRTRIQRFNPTMTAATDFLVVGAMGSLTLDTSRTYVAPTQNGNRIAVKVRRTDSSNSFHIAEFDLAGNLAEVSIPDSGFSSVDNLGLGSNPVTDTIYLPLNGDGFLVLGTPPSPPVPLLDPITTFDTRGATFTGTVDPMGAPVSCTFQYSADQINWTDIREAACDSLAPGGGAQAVEESVTDLIPGTHYFVRLGVQRLFDRSTIVNSDREFTTDAESPVISDVGAVDVSDTSALLVGAINPNNAPTTYTFHYGAPAIDTQTPEGNLPSGNSDVVVTEQVTGLTPDTTYQLKLAADNGNPDESAVVTFHTRSEPLPEPGGRRLEMVSPPYKEGGSAVSGGSDYVVSFEGDNVLYCTSSSFGKSVGQTSFGCIDQLSKRTANGWETKTRFFSLGYLTPPIVDPCRPFDYDDAGLSGGGALLSADFEQSAFGRVDLPGCALDPAATVPAGNLYLTDRFSEPESFELLSPAGNPSAQAASRDFRHILYTSPERQTDDAPAGSFSKLFHWHDGDITLVSRDTANNPFLTSSSIPGGGDYEANAVSDGGNRIFFQNGSPSDIYMQENATATHHVSASECTSSCGADVEVRFQRATPSGSVVLFTSSARLTDTDTNPTGSDLYLYTHSANPAADPNLTLLNRDEEASDGSDAGFTAVLGMSESGDIVYFVATGQIVAGRPTAGGPKIYRWSHNSGSPTVEYLATLSERVHSTEVSDDDNWSGLRGTVRKVTPSGEHLLLHSELRLEPVADHDADSDFYRWDPRGGWRCVSCQFPGAPSSGDAEGVSNPTQDQVPPNQISDDGKHVFFATPDALLPEDTNASGGCPFLRDAGNTGFLPRSCKDVYEWHDGTIGLISTGTNPDGSHFIGAGASGRDIFFATTEKMVGWDTDSASDIYDARIGGGFPEPPPIEPPCEGEACRGAGSSAGAATGAGTRAFDGPGDPTPSFSQRRKARCPRGKRKVVRKGKTRCVRRQSKKRGAKRAGRHRRADADRRASR